MVRVRWDATRLVSILGPAGGGLYVVVLHPPAGPRGGKVLYQGTDAERAERVFARAAQIQADWAEYC